MTTKTTNKAKGLTDTSIKTAKPTDKEYKLFDGGGLYCNGLIKQDTLIGSIYTANRGVYDSEAINKEAEL